MKAEEADVDRCPTREGATIPLQGGQQDAEEVEALYMFMAENIQRDWVGQSLTTANITSLEFQCKYIEHALNARFGYVGHMYEVLLYLNESTRCVEMGYRIKPEKDPEPTLPRASGFTRLLPKY